jgi:transcriptional regulator with GAF, ATPase, and Fis domain
MGSSAHTLFGSAGGRNRSSSECFHVHVNSKRAVHGAEQALGLSDLPLPLGRSETMRRVHDQIRRLATNDTTTLIYGETGTGKELVAAALHRLSRRGSEPYICVNCGGLPDGLVESELLGHVRGAFTGAFQERTGRFEAAHGGTLFLDEIGDISPAVQIRLLRILETKCVEPVGSHRARKVDVRILAATNKRLCDEVGAQDDFAWTSTIASTSP